MTNFKTFYLVIQVKMICHYYGVILFLLENTRSSLIPLLICEILFKRTSSLRYFSRRRKSLIKDPLKPAKRQKITQPDIDSIGKERAARADTHDPRNRSNTSSGSSDDDDEFNTLEKFVNRSNGNLK